MALSRSSLTQAATLAVLSSALLLGASSAGAVSFFVTELSGCTAAGGQWDCLGQNPLPSQVITIGIRVKSEPGEQVFGIGASVWGYDAFFQFESGEAVESLFHGVRTVGIGPGLDNGAGGSLSEVACCGIGPRVQILNAISFNARSENPLDPGLDGVLGGGDAQVRVRLRALGNLGGTQFHIGTDFANPTTGDGIVYAGGLLGPGNNALVGLGMSGFYVVQPVPEPGTALLIGIGLALMSSKAQPFRQSADNSSTLDSVTNPSSV